MPKPQNNVYNWKVGALASCLWIFLASFQVLLGVGISDVIIRSFLYTGASFVCIALIAIPLARITRHNILEHRRASGFVGFVFMIIHYSTMVFVMHNGFL